MQKALDTVYLSALSPKDKRWDDRKAENKDFQQLYYGTVHHGYSIRLGNCSERLVFAFRIAENGVCKLVLTKSKFCRVPTCPICLARRSMKWQAKSIKILPHLFNQHPKARFVFLTLTVSNPHITELRSALSAMHHAWTKLVKRKEFAPIQGWIRSTEVTREIMKEDGTATNYAHPHYHCLLMVKPSYFTGHSYVSQERWTEIWQSCLKVDYLPIVHVKAVHPPKSLSDVDKRAAVMKAVVEVVKYTTKPSDLIRDVKGLEAMSNQDWLVEITTQLHGIKKIATGGVLKEYYKLLEDEREDDLTHINEDGQEETEGDLLGIEQVFKWEDSDRRYRMEHDQN